ncbi:MAG: glutamate--cysteine ligase, partial [Leucothrix sp.]
LMDAMLPIAKLLDKTHSRTCYQQALAEQRTLFENAELTPSAQVLSTMMSEHSSYYDFANHQSQQHREYFNQRSLSAQQWDTFTQKATDSLAAQKTLEAQPQINFDTFLQQYFNGSL